MAVPRGLSPQDLDQIREGLAAGRKPKVVFTASAGQVAGTVGQIVGLADPASSDEWIVVKFGRDELPFSPADLAIPTKAPAQRKATAAATSSTKAAAATTKAAREKPEPQPPAPAKAVAVPPEETVSMTETKAEPAPPKKVAKPKAPASLTVTLSYTDREWMVAATQGSKTLAKPYVIRPTDALRMVALLDVPGVHEAVEAIIAAERAEAETRAQRLRDELAEIEARLTELTDPR